MSVPSFELRPAGPADEPFFFELYAAIHGQQFALLPLAPAQREALVRMQFDAQSIGYRSQFPGSQEFVIMAGGDAAGRLWLHESSEGVRIIDIAIAPARQGHGFGRAVIEGVIRSAAAAGKPVRLSVARMNTRAFELYRRLGFEVCSQDEVYLEMKRDA